MSDFNACFVRTSTVIAECVILVFIYSIYNNFLYKEIDMFYLLLNSWLRERISNWISQKIQITEILLSQLLQRLLL